MMHIVFTARSPGGRMFVGMSSINHNDTTLCPAPITGLVPLTLYISYLIKAYCSAILARTYQWASDDFQYIGWYNFSFFLAIILTGYVLVSFTDLLRLPMFSHGFFVFKFWSSMRIKSLYPFAQHVHWTKIVLPCGILQANMDLKQGHLPHRCHPNLEICTPCVSSIVCLDWVLGRILYLSFLRTVSSWWVAIRWYGSSDMVDHNE